MDPSRFFILPDVPRTRTPTEGKIDRPGVPHKRAQAADFSWEGAESSPLR